VEFHASDVRDRDAVRRALRDCDVVFHAAGPTTTWGALLRDLRNIHAGGTEQVLRAMPRGARLVHTSSVVTVGASTSPRLLTESSSFDWPRLKVDYVHAKRAAEELVLAAATRGLDATVVNPGYLIGPEDYGHSAMGRFCLRTWKNRIPVIPRGGFNCVDVRDVAVGHLLAAERGQPGRRYILGGENRSLLELVRELTEVHGRRTRWLCSIPPLIHRAMAGCAQIVAARKRRDPHTTVQESRMASLYWFYSSARAESELGYRARPLRTTLQDTHDWECLHGKLKPLRGPRQHLAETRAAA
jgi:dihydroflavonol-4-reductase